MTIKNNVFSKAAITGLFLAATSVWMMIAGAIDMEGIWMPSGFNVPILALEFGSSTSEISNIIATISTESIAKIYFSTQIDMVFLFVYNLFLFFVLQSIFKITKLNQYKWLAIVPIIIALTDLTENIQLFNALQGEDFNIWILKISTWVKWLGLALVFTAIGRFLITTERYFDKVLALSTFTTLPLGIWAMFSHSGINEVFAMLFYLLFPLTIIYTWFSGIKKKV